MINPMFFRPFVMYYAEIWWHCMNFYANSMSNIYIRFVLMASVTGIILWQK